MPKKKVARVEGEVDVGGRPRIEIEWAQVDQMCQMQCTALEIAGVLGCSVDTLNLRLHEEKGMGFKDYFYIKGSAGKVSLRRKQFQTALAGNVTMLIWLGKQVLDQKDKSEIDQTIKASVVDNDEERKRKILKRNPKARELLKQLAEIRG